MYIQKSNLVTIFLRKRRLMLQIIIGKRLFSLGFNVFKKLTFAFVPNTVRVRFPKLTIISHLHRILQVNTVLAMLYYSWAHTELKKTVVENRTKACFPLIVLTLLVVEFILVIGPALNLRASQMHQRCYYLADSAAAGWLYFWVFPYLLPLLLAAVPMFRIAMKLRDASYNMTEAVKTQNYVVLSTCGGYFFFQLLYYTLTLWYLVAKDKDSFRAVVWFLLRPMFALIGYGWHIVTPLAPFVFDKDFYQSFPGNLVYRKRFEMRQEEDTRFNSINLTPTNTWPSSNNNATSPNGHTSKVTFSEPHQHREFNNPVVMEVEISLEDDRDLNNSSIA